MRARCDCACRCRLKASIGDGSSRAFLPCAACVDAARHRLQQLARVLEIAAPEHRRAFAGEAIGGIGGHPVVADHDALRRARLPLSERQRAERLSPSSSQVSCCGG